jgi:unsaturated rhamnogalacturonyl hydrolase
MKHRTGLACFAAGLHLLVLLAVPARAQSPGVGLAAAAMRLWPDTGEVSTARYTFDEAVAWKGLEGLWYNTGDARYFKYVQRQMDRRLDKDGNIFGGRILLLLYKVTGQEKYYKAAGRLRQQLKDQPRTSEDSFYMAQPFFAEYAALFHEDSIFDDISRQFAAIEKHVRDPQTGFCARAMGWYGMALVDVLEQYPIQHPGRKTLLEMLGRYAAAVQKVEDPASGSEASASSMVVYTLAKGVRLGYLPESYLAAAEKGYKGILTKFITVGGQSAGTGAAAAFGKGDPKGIGAFLLAADEMDMLAGRNLGKGRTVLLDCYFNNEHHKDITGIDIRFHYAWDEMDNNGYSLWGHLFHKYGMITDTLAQAPAASRLKKASVYIIVDPDNEKESPAPNYPDGSDITAIAGWVKAGGVLVLLGNDSANMEFTHFNTLTEKFGIHFNFDDYHKVTGDQFEMGAFTMTGQEGIFKTAKKIYIKELSTLKLSGTATPLFTDSGKVIMAVARVGKGTVFAVGDPWFYNEYTDGRKLPADFENFNAARDLTQWLIRQAK